MYSVIAEGQREFHLSDRTLVVQEQFKIKLLAWDSKSIEFIKLKGNIFYSSDSSI
ncbi:MAG: hypothetical protein QNJ54_02570 [Prochloraceae cyanobacterium]|nr:hypothetical protein [Prochloraceae cyanobacterium]